MYDFQSTYAYAVNNPIRYIDFMGMGAKEEEEAKKQADKEKKEKAKTKRIKFDPHRFNELEMEIHRLEELRPEVEKEWRTLDAKGKTTRAEHRRKRLAKIDSELEGLYEEWMMLGEKKKKWK